MLDIETIAALQDPAGQKLEFALRTKETVHLRIANGDIVEIDARLYPRLVAQGIAARPGEGDTADTIPDEHARLHQAMVLHALRREKELRSAGNSAKKASEILRDELHSDSRYHRYAPARLSLRTLQNWRQKLLNGGKAALIPHIEKRGNRGARFDFLYEEIAWDVLEEVFLKTDRVSIGTLVPQVKERYLTKCREQKVKPGPSGKRSLQAVLETLPADDIIKSRHDTETSKKLRLQAQFFHRVKAPLDLIEIDCTIGDIFLLGVSGLCIGRPVICAAIDVATGFVVGLRVTLEAENEALTVATLKDVMTDRGSEFFERYGIQNPIETTGSPKVINSDQGSGNSGPQLTSIIRNINCEWGKNTPGCPERKPHVERFNLELNRFLHTLPGASYSKDLPNKARIDKGMLEATYTLDELEALLMKWVYDVYAQKVRRTIHSPLRRAESPAESWKRLGGELIIPEAPENIREIFMIEKTTRKVQHYGIEVEGVHFHSDELRDLIKRRGRKATVEIRYDPSDIREISVLDPDTGNHFHVTAKSEDVLAVSFADAKKMRDPTEEAKHADAGARATAGQMAIDAQKLAESRGKGKVTSLKSARAKEKLRQRHQEIFDRSKHPPSVNPSALTHVNQPTPKLAVKRPSQLPVLDPME